MILYNIITQVIYLQEKQKNHTWKRRTVLPCDQPNVDPELPQKTGTLMRHPQRIKHSFPKHVGGILQFFTTLPRYALSLSPTKRWLRSVEESGALMRHPQRIKYSFPKHIGGILQFFTTLPRYALSLWSTKRWLRSVEEKAYWRYASVFYEPSKICTPPTRRQMLTCDPQNVDCEV